MPQPLFVFIQLEFPWTLGPADGRYLVRRHEDREPERVVVLGAQEASRLPLGALLGSGRTGGWLPRRRSRLAPVVPAGPEPEPVTTTRVTVIDPVSLSAESQARAWLADLDRDHEVQRAVEVVNRVIHSHRIATADPYTHEVSPAQALVIRAGWGEGEQVADGRWLHARALPWPAHGRRTAGSRRAPRRDRSSALRPQERLAALLGVRSSALMCEELALRARADLDHHRLAHAALELDHALALAPLELGAEQRQDLTIRIAELEQLHPAVTQQAQAALGKPGDLPSGKSQAKTDEDVIAHALERLEATLRARTATGFAS
jgi:hypothetical protein